MRRAGFTSRFFNGRCRKAASIANGGVGRNDWPYVHTAACGAHGHFTESENEASVTPVTVPLRMAQWCIPFLRQHGGKPEVLDDAAQAGSISNELNTNASSAAKLRRIDEQCSATVSKLPPGSAV